MNKSYVLSTALIVLANACIASDTSPPIITLNPMKAAEVTRLQAELQRAQRARDFIVGNSSDAARRAWGGARGSNVDETMRRNAEEKVATLKEQLRALGVDV